jgi:hypothetical protein
MDSEAFHPRVFLAEGRDGEVISRVETHCILVSFGDNRQPGWNRSAHCTEQLSAHAGIPYVRCGRNVEQGDGGIAHRVVDHTDRIVFDNGGEEDRCGIIPVALNNVPQSLVVTTRRKRQQTGYRGTVVDRRGVNLDDAVAHIELVVVDASV